MRINGRRRMPERTAGSAPSSTPRCLKPTRALRLATWRARPVDAGPSWSGPAVTARDYFTAHVIPAGTVIPGSPQGDCVSGRAVLVGCALRPVWWLCDVRGVLEVCGTQGHREIGDDEDVNHWLQYQAAWLMKQHETQADDE